MKLTIEKLDYKTINTARGEAVKIGVFSGGKWYSCFKGQWNSGWTVGQEIDYEIETKPGKEPGQVYHNIKAPNSGGFGGGASEIKTMIQELSSKMDKALAAIEALKQPTSTDDIPF